MEMVFQGLWCRAILAGNGKNYTIETADQEPLRKAVSAINIPFSVLRWRFGDWHANCHKERS
jgi:hypothetical protein